MPSSVSSPAIRAFLEASGYEIRFRAHEWVECLVIGHGEAWLGRGVDQGTALHAAMSDACPTRLSVSLLEEAVGRHSRAKETRTAPIRPQRIETLWNGWTDRGPPLSLAPLSGEPDPSLDSDSDYPSEEPDAPLSSPGLSASVLAASSLAPEDEGRYPNDIMRAEGRPSLAAERSAGQIAVIVSRPAVPRPSFMSLPPPELAPGRESGVPDDPEVSLEELDILMERIRDSREELGLCAPDRQRLAMLAWICEARAHADAFPDDLRIRDRVGAISRQLTEIGKTFWPGSVTALQLHMQPKDLPRHLLGGTATTWNRAAELAEQALRNKEHEDERRGFDAHGWSDGKQTQPRPLWPDRLLEQLAVEVERVSGSLETQAAPADSAFRPDPVVFQRWVRELRWLRCSDIDPLQWARLAGRLRWWAFRREAALLQAAKELEPNFVPPYSWASLLGQDPERRRHEQKLREVLGQPIPADQAATPASLVDWLVRALPFADTHHSNIVKLTEPYKDRVLAILPDEVPDAERRLRRRLIRLQADLRDGLVEVKPAALPDMNMDIDERGGELIEVTSDPPVLPEDLLARVRVVTFGKRAVLVSNRRDPDLQVRMQDAFGFSLLDCRIAEPRRLQVLGEAIHDGQYDLVLGATGFQSQDMDNVLARACRLSGVHYVRVNRGRVIACLRAIGRDLSRLGG